MNIKKIGVVKEVKAQENRVGLVPAGVRTLVELGCEVLVEKGAGLGSGLSDAEYQKAGGKIVSSAKEVWSDSNMIIKVKEPLPQEFDLIQNGQVVFTYFHLAVVPELAKVLVDKKVTAVAYETIQTPDGGLPLLKPMSEVAGKMSVQVGSTYLQKEHGGAGVLLGGVPGVKRGKVAIIGGGVVGTNACKIAVGMGAEVTVIDVNVDRLEYLDDIFGSRITTLKSHSQNIEDAVKSCDLLVGAVLIPGAKAPRLVSRDLVSKMRPGSVIVDVAVDQGGCVETCKPTTHEKPTYLVDGVVHYCVANIPGAVSMSSTYALTNATISYAKKLVELGPKAAAQTYADLKAGFTTAGGYITYKAVADDLNMTYKDLSEVL